MKNLCFILMFHYLVFYHVSHKSVVEMLKDLLHRISLSHKHFDLISYIKPNVHITAREDNF